MDKEIYSVLLDASSCVNPVQHTGKENPDTQIAEEDQMTLFQYSYTKKNIDLMVQMLSRSDFEARELNYAKNVDFLYNLVNGFVTEEAVRVLEFLGNKISLTNPMLSYRKSGYTPVLKFINDMFKARSPAMIKLRNNPDLVLEILKALEKIGADVSAAFNNEEMLRKHLADPKNVPYLDYSLEGSTILHILADFSEKSYTDSEIVPNHIKNIISTFNINVDA